MVVDIRITRFFEIWSIWAYFNRAKMVKLKKHIDKDTRHFIQYKKGELGNWPVALPKYKAFHNLN